MSESKTWRLFALFCPVFVWAAWHTKEKGIMPNQDTERRHKKMTKKKEKRASEKVKQIVEAIQKKTAMPAYQLIIQEGSRPDIFESKFGGVPYWDFKKDYPADKQGKPMMMIAQINFTNACLEDSRLPEQGLLQFFISSEDDLFGADFDEMDVQHNFRVIYHETIDYSVTKEQVASLGIPVCTEDGAEYSPVFKEAAVTIEKTTAYLGTEVNGFYELFRDTVKELFNEELGNRLVSEYLNDDDWDYLYEALSAQGHRILGYPYFTQSDPREDMEYFDTLLFQMDSDMLGMEDYVLWGDCGVGNFFMNSRALAARDFSRVLYSWDCC